MCFKSLKIKKLYRKGKYVLSLMPNATCEADIVPALRAQTHDVHIRLHDHPITKDLISSTLTIDQYCWVLFSFQRFYQALCASNYPRVQEISRTLCTYLSDDCHAINAAPNALPHNVAIYGSECPDHALGVLYVIHGSSLGGQLIAKNLQKTLSLDNGNGASFFNRKRAKGEPNWSEFLNILQEECISHTACVQGAVQTFEALEQWLWVCEKNRQQLSSKEKDQLCHI